MTKNVAVHIVAKQFYAGDDAETTEFFTEGHIFEKNDEVFLEYDETELSGFSGGHTRLVVNKDKVTMSRVETGDGAGDTVMEFSKGNRYTGFYRTPMGIHEIEVLANEIDIEIDKQKLTGKIDIDYNFSLKGLIEGRNIFFMEIKEKTQNKSRNY